MIFDDKSRVTLPNGPLPGICEAVNAAGIWIEQNGKDFYASDQQAAQAILDAYEPTAYVIAQQRAALGAEWWRRSQLGHMTSLGVPVHTDDGSLAKITGAYNCAKAEAAKEFNFIDKGGQWRALNADEMVTLFNDVAAFVQNLFNFRKQIDQQIAAAQDWKEAQAIDVTVGWPE